MADAFVLETPRLRLLAADGRMARAEVDDHRALGALLNARIPPDWPPAMVADVLEYFARQLDEDPACRGWLTWFWIWRDGGGEGAVLIGSGGFHSRPTEEGAVEIGYSVLPAFQARGFAGEAVAALLGWAFSHPYVTRLTAETMPELRPSIRVLERAGFRLMGTRYDRALLYELPREAYRAARDDR